MNSISLENRYGDDKVYDACGLCGILDVTGRRFSGDDIVKAITNMTERGNGLGSGYAVYGCYPEYEDCYAFHVMYIDADGRFQFGSSNWRLSWRISALLRSASTRGVLTPSSLSACKPGR